MQTEQSRFHFFPHYNKNPTYIELGCILETGLAVTWDQNVEEVALSGLQSTLPLFHYMRFCSHIPSFPWWHCSKMFINLLSLVFVQKIVTILNLKSDIFKSNIMVKKNPTLNHLPTKLFEVCCILKSGGQWEQTSFPNNLNVRHIITVICYKTETIKVLWYLCHLIIPMHVKLSQWCAEIKKKIFWRTVFFRAS